MDVGGGMVGLGGAGGSRLGDMVCKNEMELLGTVSLTSSYILSWSPCVFHRLMDHDSSLGSPTW